MLLFFTVAFLLASSAFSLSLSFAYGSHAIENSDINGGGNCLLVTSEQSISKAIVFAVFVRCVSIQCETVLGFKTQAEKQLPHIYR